MTTACPELSWQSFQKHDYMSEKTYVCAKYVRKEHTRHSDFSAALKVRNASKSSPSASERELETEGGYHTVGMQWPWTHQEISTNRSCGPLVHCGLIALLAKDKTNNRAPVSYKGLKQQHQTQRPDKALQAKWIHKEVTVLLTTNSSSNFWLLHVPVMYYKENE